MDDSITGTYQLLKSDFEKLAYLKNEDLAEYDLTGCPKHEVFEYSNMNRPHGFKRLWPQCKSRADYDSLCVDMEPVFLLASMILESPASLDFIYYIIYSPREPVPGQHDGIPLSSFRPDGSTPEHRRRLAKEALRRLAQSVTFEISNKKDRPDMEGSYGFTSFVLEGFDKGISIKDSLSLEPEPTGLASLVHISQDFLDRLIRLRTNPGSDNTGRILRLCLKTAATFCHEITHSIEFAANKELWALVQARLKAAREQGIQPVHPIGRNESFWKQQSVAEVGFSFEGQVFGGRLDFTDNFDHPLFFANWPSFLYHGDLPQRKGYKKTATKYLVPMQFVFNLFTKAFWRDVYAEPHTNALYIKKVFGYRVKCPSGLPVDLEWDAEESSEGEWPTDPPPSSRVNRDAIGEEDPSSKLANKPL